MKARCRLHRCSEISNSRRRRFRSDSSRTRRQDQRCPNGRKERNEQTYLNCKQTCVLPTPVPPQISVTSPTGIPPPKRVSSDLIHVIIGVFLCLEEPRIFEEVRGGVGGGGGWNGFGRREWRLLDRCNRGGRLEAGGGVSLHVFEGDRYEVMRFSFLTSL